MRLTPLLLSVALLVTSAVRAQPVTASTPPPRDPFASAGDPFAMPASGARFADFCRANPSATQPIGSKLLWFEALLVEVESGKVPAKNDEPPTPEMLAKGKLVRIEVRANSSASGGNFYLLDRAPDGRLLEGSDSREIGTRIFIHLPPDGTSAAIFAGDTEFEAWVASGSGPEPRAQQPVYSTREINTRLTLSQKWASTGGMTREQVTRKADGTEQKKKMTLLMFFRLLSEDPAKAVPAAPAAAK